MQRIPDGSVDCIICDLPYGTMKGARLDGWKIRDTEWDNRIDTTSLFFEYERCLRPKGIMVLFSQEPYTSHLRQFNQSNIRFAYPLIWLKNHFANPLMAKKAPLSYFEDMSVFYKEYDSQLSDPARTYAKKILDFIGLSKKDVVQAIGQKADHFFRYDTLQFCLCTEDTYNDLINNYHIDEMEGFLLYNQLPKIEKTFNLQDGARFMSNVLSFKKDYQGFHPTQKPVALLEYLIKTYSNEGDTILDNTMGSGSTGVACVNTRRNFIGIELDDEYFAIAEKRIKKAQQQQLTFVFQNESK